MSYLERVKAFEALNNKELIEKMASYRNKVKRSGCPGKTENE